MPSHTLTSIKDTEKLATAIAKNPPKPAILALVGQLGAGKTTFTTALARALKTTSSPSSPTFVWLKTYQLNDKRFRRLHHIDCYRTQGLDPELADTITECQKDPDALTVIEWADKIKNYIAPTATWLTFRLDPGGVRKVTVTRSQ